MTLRHGKQPERSQSAGNCMREGSPERDHMPPRIRLGVKVRDMQGLEKQPGERGAAFDLIDLDTGRGIGLLIGVDIESYVEKHVHVTARFVVEGVVTDSSA